MFTVQHARSKLLPLIEKLPSETVEVSEACGRICAEDIVVSESIPSRKISLRDGYAVRSEDLANAKPSKGLLVTGMITAGALPDLVLEPGTSIKITTGAPLPEGADSVVPYEDAVVRHGSIFVHATVTTGQFVMFPGEIAEPGDLVVRAGSIVTPMTVSSVVDCGKAYLDVVQKPKVGIVVTGNEVVEAGRQRESHQVYCSNRYLLGTLTKNYGGEEVILGILPDDERKIISVLKSEHGCDCVILSGGTGKGEHDHVKAAWKRAGIELIFDGVLMHPARSTACGIKDRVLYFSLPGNPLASGIAFVQFVSVALLNMMGIEVASPPCMEARLLEKLKLKRDGVNRFVWGKAVWKKRELTVCPITPSKKGLLQKMSEANCIIDVVSSSAELQKGDYVLVQPVCFCPELSYLSLFSQ